jgi:hypothetical protein
MTRRRNNPSMEKMVSHGKEARGICVLHFINLGGEFVVCGLDSAHMYMGFG